MCDRIYRRVLQKTTDGPHQRRRRDEGNTVEINLTYKFKTAKSWGAVLLIDEADVFMERRGTADLERNSLVAGKRSLSTADYQT